MTEFLQRYPDGVFAPLALDRLAELEWGRLKSAADIEAFLQRWPGCRFESAARARLTALQRKTERTGSGVSGTVTAGVAVGVLALAAAGYAFWSASTPPTPQPSHIPATKQPSAAELADDKAFAAAKNDRSKAALEAYLKSDGRHARTLLRKLDAAAYEAAERANTAVAFKGYRDEWPNGQYLGLAEQRIAALEAAAKVEAERKQAEERAQADDETYVAAKSKGTKAALEAYLKNRLNSPSVLTGQKTEGIWENIVPSSFLRGTWRNRAKGGGGWLTVRPRTKPWTQLGSAKWDWSASPSAMRC